MNLFDELQVRKERERLLNEVIYAGIAAFHKFMGIDREKYDNIIFRLFEVSKTVSCSSLTNKQQAAEELKAARERYQEILAELQ